MDGNKKYYIDAEKGSIAGDGSIEHPFLKIQQAADIAAAGDEIVVYPGIYRENVNPKHAGEPEKPIVYRSFEPLRAVISGAEPVKNWEKTEGNVWRAELLPEMFTEENPFTREIFGDWYVKGKACMHTGEVFLNQKSMYEVQTLAEVNNPTKSSVSWEPEFSLYTWCVEQKDNKTILYANFHGKNPNEENVEISVRESCFLPKQEGIGYITLSGFTVCMAATQWAPPTAYQTGMIGPHWSKGWVIEDCEIFESKCVGISLGKYLQPNNENKWSNWKHKDGTQTERDSICQAANEGWSKETVGSHIIRRCHIHDCGQAGIVGHMGCVFSVIEDNYIHHINFKQNLYGHEIGGIKLHAAIDVLIQRNHFYFCTRGIWLDWQAQGTRVTKNLFHDNVLPAWKKTHSSLGEDLFIEVSHGPTMIDHNIFLSERAIKLATQGVALVNNLIAGSLVAVGMGTNNGTKKNPSPRYTPYHVPHDTRIAGFMTILHGDNRVYNNIFIQQPIRKIFKKLSMMKYLSRLIPGWDWDDMNLMAGTKPFDGYPTFEEWDAMFQNNVSSDAYYMHLPVWTGGNVYMNGAIPCKKEKNYLQRKETITISLEVLEDGWYLDTDIYKYMAEFCGEKVTTESLGKAFEAEERYENPDGTPYDLVSDYFGVRNEQLLPGPFAEGQRAAIRVWGK